MSKVQRRTLLPILAGLAAMLCGAVLWAGIGYLTSIESGWVALGIGAGIGALMTWLGARGRPLAVAAALFALVSILAGKWFANDAFLRRELRQGAEARLTIEAYRAYAKKAELYASLPKPIEDSALRANPALLGGSGDPSASDEELERWRATVGRDLEAFLAERPDHAAWQAKLVDRAIAQTLSHELRVEAYETSLSGFDVLWVLLGVVSAFGLVSKATREESS